MQISRLEDFIDEEVWDHRGRPIGVLACYWESASNHLFLGVKPEGDEEVRVVPGSGAHLDEAHSCVKIDFPGADVRTAPVFDCDAELRPRLEGEANEHFAVPS